MKVFRRSLFVLLCLFMLPFMVGLFYPHNLLYERSIVIDKPVYNVYNYIACLTNHQKFSPWYIQGGTTIVNCNGGNDASNCGYSYNWTNINGRIGPGSEEILCIAEADRVETIVRLNEPFINYNYSTLITEKLNENQTKVTWKMKSHLPNPFNALHLICKYDEKFGSYLEESLFLLKQNVETFE